MRAEATMVGDRVIPVARPSDFLLFLFGWDEIAGEVYQIADGDMEQGWTNPETYVNGVKLLLSDRNHVGLEVEAESPEQAGGMFAAVSSEYRKCLEERE